VELVFILIFFFFFLLITDEVIVPVNAEIKREIE
jgi:hypothetical protein